LWSDQSASLASPVAFSPDGTLLASSMQGKGNAPESLALRDVESGAVRTQVSALTSVANLTFAPSGKVLAVETHVLRPNDYLVHLLDNGGNTAIVPGWDPGQGWRIRFDGRGRAAALAGDGKFKLYDASSGAPQCTLHYKDVWPFILSSDGRLLLGYHRQRELFLLYDFPEMVERVAVPVGKRDGEAPRLGGKPFSPDNRYAVTIDSLETPYLRAGQTLEVLCRFPSYSTLISDTVFGPDYTLAILEGGKTSNVTIYDLPAIRRGLTSLGLDWSE
jgi:WD40 repeat protein